MHCNDSLVLLGFHKSLSFPLDVQDAFAKGEVFVGSGENGYSVQKGLPSGTQGNFSWHYGITIVTPDRDYLFTCETETDQLEWIRAFTSVIDQAMTPQEYASKCLDAVSFHSCHSQSGYCPNAPPFFSLQLKPTSSLNPRKPCRNHTMTRLYLVLLGGCQDRKGD